MRANSRQVRGILAVGDVNRFIKQRYLVKIASRIRDAADFRSDASDFNGYDDR